MPQPNKLYDGLLRAYLTNDNFRGAVVNGLQYSVAPDLTYVVRITFTLHHCAEYNPVFWMTDPFELDKYVISVLRTKTGQTEVAFRNPDYDRKLFLPLLEYLK